MTKEDIAKIRQVSIKKVLGIEDTGRKVFIRCPFHNEKTPSLCIFNDGSYRCFGCGKHGQNAIDFFMDGGATFNEIVAELEKYV